MGVMSGSGFLENGDNQGCRRMWRTPQMSVLMFRGTAQSPQPQQSQKGKLDCDGSTLASPAGSGDTAKATIGSTNPLGHSKSGANPEQTQAGCPTSSFT